MIEGNGDIASVLRDRNGFTFFARGVSNSQETDECEYQREKNILVQQDRRNRLVYFGSLSVFDNQDNPSRYVRHKMEMEAVVKVEFPKWTIVRLGNITWGTNPHTLINHLRHQVETVQPVEIRDVYRYVVDQEEFNYWIDRIPDWNCEMNVPGQRMKVIDIFKKYV
jgi:hypothetical protein